MSAQHVGLGERRVGDQQRQVDGELHAGAGADRADVLDAPAELVEDGARAGNVGPVAAGQAEQLAVPRRSGGAADRALDETRRLWPAPWRPVRRLPPAAPCSCR